MQEKLKGIEKRIKRWDVFHECLPIEITKKIWASAKQHTFTQIITFRNEEADGTLLKTKVSKRTGEIPKNLWRRILKQQLNTTQEEFNKIV